VNDEPLSRNVSVRVPEAVRTEAEAAARYSDESLSSTLRRALELGLVALQMQDFAGFITLDDDCDG